MHACAANVRWPGVPAAQTARDAIETSKKSVDAQAVAAQAEGAPRRLEALQLVAYKLDRLAWHIDGSRRILNDLRTLRRLLLGERQRA